MEANKEIRVVLAKPRGFCAGVERAIEIVESAIRKYGAPVYVRHEIVHNRYVVEDLKAKGAIFVDNISDVPDGAISIFSAHGVSEKIENEAKARGLPVIDATCPLVKKVHREAQRHEEQGYRILLIGHEGHPEVEGTSGRVQQEVTLIQNIEDVQRLSIPEGIKLAYVTQTTLSVDDTKTIIEALKNKFSHIEGPDLRDICYATQNRQTAVRNLTKEVDLMLVIGSKNSSNSNRLRDLAIEMGKAAYLINGPEDIQSEWINKIESVGITAGASAPEVLLEKVIDRLREIANIKVETMEGVNENVKFKLPSELEEAL